jgi:hypothetical protein
VSARRERAGLRSLQRWFAGVVQHPRGVLAGLRAHGRQPADGSRVNAATAGQGAARLQVYGEAYFARLVEVMAGDYPALRAFVGERRFAAWAKRYLVRCPSRHPNLNQLGARFPRHVRAVEGGSAIAVALADIELAVTRAFDAPARTPWSADALAAVSPTRWRRLRLELDPSVQLLRVPAAAADRYVAWGTGKSTASRTGAVELLVVRTDDQVQRFELPRGAARVLRRLRRGATFGEALAGLPATAPVGEWFARWRALGVFAAVG